MSACSAIIKNAQTAARKGFCLLCIVYKKKEGGFSILLMFSYGKEQETTV